MKEKLSTFARRTSLRQLRALGAVARAGAISPAANMLGVTAPAVSQQLRLLETALGSLPLLERGPAGLRPTALGQEAIAALDRIEAALADCAAAAAAQRGMEAGRVAIGVISTAKYFAPFALAAFQRAHPGIELRVQVGNRSDTVAALESFDLDLAIMGYPPEHLDIERAVIGDHPHVVIAPPGHPMVGRRQIPLSEIARETFLLREPGSGTRDLMQRLSGGLDGPIGPRTEIGSNETIKQAVMAGMGIALISAHTIAAEVADGRLVVLDVERLPVVRTWYIVRRREKRLLPPAQALWDFLAESGSRFLPRLDQVPSARAAIGPPGRRVARQSP
jgi:LysR family transcriptional regulator for metE and metH